MNRRSALRRIGGLFAGVTAVAAGMPTLIGDPRITINTVIQSYRVVPRIAVEFKTVATEKFAKTAEELLIYQIHIRDALASAVGVPAEYLWEVTPSEPEEQDDA